MKSALLLLLAVGCGRGAPKSTPGPGTSLASSEVDSAVEAAALDPQLEDLWARAKEGEADDLARLFDREGSLALVERGRDPAYRVTAIRALAYANEFYALPWLAETAAGADEAAALSALDSASQIASEPRRATDPEDALELKQGCAALLALAKDPSRPRARRVGAVRALRMLVERGCVNRADLPSDVDAR